MPDDNTNNNDPDEKKRHEHAEHQPEKPTANVGLLGPGTQPSYAVSSALANPQLSDGGPQDPPSYPLSLLGDPVLNKRGNGSVRNAVMLQAQQIYGNKALRRYLQRAKSDVSPSTNENLTGSSLAVQRHEGHEEDLQLQRMPAHGSGSGKSLSNFIQRQTPPSPATATTPPAASAQPQAAPKDPADDLETAKKAVEDNFKDLELKEQLAKVYHNDYRGFFKFYRAILGSSDKVISHFKDIVEVTGWPPSGKVHLHKTAASRLHMVFDKLEGAVPDTTVALGIVRGHDHPKSVTLNSHNLGYAIDFRPVENPFITDKRLKMLLTMVSETSSVGLDLGERNPSKSKKLSDPDDALKYRRPLIRKLGEETAKVKEKLQAEGKTEEAKKAEIKFDPNSKFGVQAKQFYEKLEKEHKRLTDASTKFRTEAKSVLKDPLSDPAVQQQLSVRQELHKIDAKLQRGKLKAENKKTLNERKAELQATLQTLNKQAGTDLPRIFGPWLAQIDERMKNVQNEVGNTVDLSKLHDLETEQKNLEAQQQAASAEKKKAEKVLRPLIKPLEDKKRKLEKDKMPKETSITAKENRKARLVTKGASEGASEATITKLNDEITKLNDEITQITEEKKAIETQIQDLENQINDIRARSPQSGSDQTQPGQSLKHIDDQLKELSEQIKAKKAQYDSLIAQAPKQVKPTLKSKQAEWDTLASLKKSLAEDPEFAFEGQRTVQNPSVMQLIEKGWFNPDQEPKPGEKHKPSKHGFNHLFMKAMAEHGFEIAASWGSPDTMHFELVEGLDTLSGEGPSQQAQPSQDPQTKSVPTQPTSTSTYFASIQRQAALERNETRQGHVASQAGSGNRLNANVKRQLKAGSESSKIGFGPAALQPIAIQRNDPETDEPDPTRHPGEKWPGGPTTDRKSKEHTFDEYLGWVREVEAAYGPDKENVLQRLRKLYYSEKSGSVGKKFDKVINSQPGLAYGLIQNPPLSMAALNGLFETDRIMTPKGSKLDPSHLFANLDVEVSGVGTQGGIAETLYDIQWPGVVTWAGDLASWFREWLTQKQKAEKKGQGNAVNDEQLLLSLANSKVSKDDLFADMDAQAMAKLYVGITTVPIGGKFPNAVQIGSLNQKVSDILDQFYKPPVSESGPQPISINRFPLFVMSAKPKIQHTVDSTNPLKVRLAGNAKEEIHNAIRNISFMFLDDALIPRVTTSVKVPLTLALYDNILWKIAWYFERFLTTGLDQGDAQWP